MDELQEKNYIKSIALIEQYGKIIKQQNDGYINRLNDLSIVKSKDGWMYYIKKLSCDASN